MWSFTALLLPRQYRTSLWLRSWVFFFFLMDHLDYRRYPAGCIETLVYFRWSVHVMWESAVSSVIDANTRQNELGTGKFGHAALRSYATLPISFIHIYTPGCPLKVHCVVMVLKEQVHCYRAAMLHHCGYLGSDKPLINCSFYIRHHKSGRKNREEIRGVSVYKCEIGVRSLTILDRRVSKTSTISFSSES